MVPRTHNINNNKISYNNNFSNKDLNVISKKHLSRDIVSAKNIQKKGRYDISKYNEFILTVYINYSYKFDI